MENINNVNWDYISFSQKLSEDFIREFKDKVDWDYISYYQKLSQDFIREFKDKVNVKFQEEKHKEKSYSQKLKEIKSYAEKYNLKFENNILYAFRNHDVWGRGIYNKTISYESGKYYKDWHCDLDENTLNSFGLGIWPKGNTQVKIKVEDWGVEVKDNKGKARVFGFEVMR